jgi:hypothetical protein
VTGWFVAPRNGLGANADVTDPPKAAAGSVGPVAAAVLAQDIHAGKIAVDALISRDQIAWQPITSVPEVMEALDALRRPETDPPSTARDVSAVSADMTEVIVRDDELLVLSAQGTLEPLATPRMGLASAMSSRHTPQPAMPLEIPTLSPFSSTPAASYATPTQEKISPKLALLIPLGVFAIFAVLSLLLVLVAWLTKSWPGEHS